MPRKKVESTKAFRLSRIKRIHFVGIGGVGMGGIAEVLLNRGFTITGSDRASNAMTEHLTVLGAKIMLGHHQDYVKNADVVVVSTAIGQDNIELQTAQTMRIPVVPRAEMLAELMRFNYGIAIAGTHGKTTTTSLMASILAESGFDPTYVIGGKLNSAGTNAHLGAGRYFVAEADESDASFLYLTPMIATVTNIDHDHMDTYGGNYQRLQKTFIEFLHRLPFYGLAVLCQDDPGVAEIIPHIKRPILTYGFSEAADFQAVNSRPLGVCSEFTVLRKTQGDSIDVCLNIAGKHNILNALAAIAIATDLDVPLIAIQKALASFAGVGRRFQIYGEFSTKQGDVMLVDDYGHHPREVAAVIDTVRSVWSDRRVVMVYQPHRYSRTRDLFSDFTEVLSRVDVLLLLDVYSAGELPINGIDSAHLCQSIQMRMANSDMTAIHIGQCKALPASLAHTLQNGDVLLTQGAGNIGSISAQMAQQQLCLDTLGKIFHDK